MVFDGWDTMVQGIYNMLLWNNMMWYVAIWYMVWYGMALLYFVYYGMSCFFGRSLAGWPAIP